jgi:colanic acid/amylovoran biosynthesis protein
MVGSIHEQLLMLIEIKGGQLFNLGAALMLRATIEQLSKRLPKADFVLRLNQLTPRERLSTLDIGATQVLKKIPLRKKSIDLSVLSYWWPDSFDRTFAAWGYAFEGALDAIVDISGYAYGDRWGAYPLRVTASEIERLQRSGGCYIFLPQAFGPFDAISASDKATFGFALPKAEVVLARDERSMGYLHSLAGFDSTAVRLEPDLTIGYSADASLTRGLHVDRRTALFVPNIRMLDSHSEASGDRYIATLTRLAEWCHKSGYRLVLLNHSEREDANLCRELQHRWAAAGLNVGSVMSDVDPRRVKAIIGQAGLVISSRFHACVSAIDQQVPCVATSWSHKYDELYRQFDITDSLIRDLDPAAAERWFQAWSARPLEQRTASSEQIAFLRQSVDAMWDDIASRLARARRHA